MSLKSPQERLSFRRRRNRRSVVGTAERPRLSVRRSQKHMIAQLIDDIAGRTLAYASSHGDKTKSGATVVAAREVGKRLAEKAKTLQIETAVFDRGGRPYHGRVKAVADGARETGLRF